MSFGWFSFVLDLERRDFLVLGLIGQEGSANTPVGS
jgi:hypothetical protein